MRTGLRYAALLLGITLACLGSRPVVAQQTSVTQHVTIVVERVTRVAVSGNPQPLAITDLDSQSPTASVTDQSTSYSLLTNVENARITASIDAPVPPGTRLQIGLESTLGASQGLVDISQATQAVDVVTGIQRGHETGRPITYTFSADVTQARAFADQTRTITLTVVE